MFPTKNLLIEQIVDDPRFEIMRDGSVWKFIKSKMAWKRVDCQEDRYCRVYIGKTAVLVHRLVYRKFIGQLDGKLVINHKDGDGFNNSVHNLEQITNSENVLHGLALNPEKRKLTRLKRREFFRRSIEWSLGNIDNIFIGNADVRLELEELLLRLKEYFRD